MNFLNQKRTPALSDIELIALNLTVGYMITLARYRYLLSLYFMKLCMSSADD